MCGCVSVGCSCQWTPGTGAEGWVRIWEQVHPSLPPPLLLSCLVLSLPQEAYGESDWRDLGPAGSAPLPSSSVPDGALRDTQALLRSLLAGNQAEEAALLSG